MDKQVLKFKKIILENLYKSRQHIYTTWGKPKKKSDHEVWFFSRFYVSFFHDEISFVFEHDVVVDICFTRFFLWEEIKCIFYYEGQSPEYKIISFF